MDRLADDIPPFLLDAYLCFSMSTLCCTDTHYNLHTKLLEYFLVCLVLGANLLFRSSCLCLYDKSCGLLLLKKSVYLYSQ